MLDDLGLDEILELLEDEKPHAPQRPQELLRYGTKGNCMAGFKKARCGISTGLRIGGFHYCSLHAAQKLDAIVGSLIVQLESLKQVADMNFCCGDPGDCQHNCNTNIRDERITL